MFSDFLRFWIIFTKSIIVTLNSEHSANFENCHRNPFNNCHVSFIRRLICNIFLKPGAFIHWQIKPWGQKPNVFLLSCNYSKEKIDIILSIIWCHHGSGLRNWISNSLLLSTWLCSWMLQPLVSPVQDLSVVWIFSLIEFCSTSSTSFLKKWRKINFKRNC